MEHETLAENVVVITPEQPVQVVAEDLKVVALPAKRKYTKRAKPVAKKVARTRVGSAKAQTQIPKDVSKFIDQLAKERTRTKRSDAGGARLPKVKRAELLREAIVKGAKAMGYKPQS